MARESFYSTVAGVIPVLLVVLAFQVRFTSFFTPKWMRRYAERAGALNRQMRDQMQLLEARRKYRRNQLDWFLRFGKTMPQDSTSPYWDRGQRLRFNRLKAVLDDLERRSADVLARNTDFMRRTEAALRYYRRWDLAAKTALAAVTGAALVAEALALAHLAFGAAWLGSAIFIFASTCLLLTLIGLALADELFWPGSRKRPKGLGKLPKKIASLGDLERPPRHPQPPDTPPPT